MLVVVVVGLTISFPAAQGATASTFMTLRLHATPTLGFYFYMAAFAVGQLSAHFALAMHRASERRAYRLRYAGGALWNLARHAQEMGQIVRYAKDESGTRLRIADVVAAHSLQIFNLKLPQRTLRLLPPLLLCLCAALHTSLLWLPVISFEYGGLGGFLLDPPHVTALTPFSLLSVATAIPPACSGLRAGPRLLEALWLAFSFVLPMLWMMLVTTLWVCPLRRKTQAYMLSVAEAAYAWAAHDVLLVTILVAPPQLPQYFQHLLSRDCAPINPILDQYFGYIPGLEPTCLSVHADFEPGAAVFVASTIGSSIVGLACTRAARSVLVPRVPDSDAQ
uniref:Glycerophosphocholine acyltransferase 1 n=1 Tax=Chrysotila carterae TaxID=13221 RepID=A0A7S4C058_CHRCT|mmetsp:Transcript_7173/g.15852  ORF Transcript_7173/g.15852 Transcript_7173/m.15852 type:complete len:335 (+) Transcript_7173:366-1370(+)